jgi:hypothetical protein
MGHLVPKVFLSAYTRFYLLRMPKAWYYKHVWMLYVIYEGKSMVATLIGPVYVSNALYRENFHAFGMKKCTDGRIGSYANTGL